MSVFVSNIGQIIVLTSIVAQGDAGALYYTPNGVELWDVYIEPNN